MRGLVFTEFLDLVDSTFGATITEAMIEQAQLRSGGAYTSVGSYPHSEMVSLVRTLSLLTGRAEGDLVRGFGTYLLDRFAAIHPEFFEGFDDVMAFIEQVDNYIHVEVRKLHADAELPSIRTSRTETGDLVVNYSSVRQMGDLAEGLIEGAIAYFGNGCSYTRENLEQEGGAQCIRFTLKKYLQ